MAFWTVLRVTSLPLRKSWSAGIWRLHEIPKMVRCCARVGTNKWKYE